MQTFIPAQDGVAIYGLAFDPNERHLALVDNDGYIRVWDAQSGVEKIAWEGHQGDVYAVVFSPDGAYLATSGADAKIRIWDWQTGELDRVLSTDESPVRAVAFSQDGQYIAGVNHNGDIWVWDFYQEGPEGDSAEVQLYNESPVRTVAFHPNGTALATGSEDGIVRLWNWRTGKVVYLRGHQRWVESVAFHPNGQQMVTAGHDGTIRVWPASAQDAIAMACARVSRDLSEDEWKQYIRETEYQSVCPRARGRNWTESDRMPSPRDPIPRDSLLPTPSAPIIYYFEAVPSTKVAPGESVVIRWDLSNAQQAFLNYKDREDGITAPGDRSVRPGQTITYRLVAINEVGQTEAELTINVEDQ
jgi:tricorn protease-like protein